MAWSWGVQDNSPHHPYTYLPVLLCPALFWTSFARSPGKPSLDLAIEMDPRARGTLGDIGAFLPISQCRPILTREDGEG